MSTDKNKIFLETLLERSKPQFHSLISKAIEIYEDRGTVTVKQHASMLTAATHTKTPVPDEFMALEPFTPKNPYVPPVEQSGEPKTDTAPAPQASAKASALFQAIKNPIRIAPSAQVEPFVAPDLKQSIKQEVIADVIEALAMNAEREARNWREILSKLSGDA
jgi:hypothetical protein